MSNHNIGTTISRVVFGMARTMIANPFCRAATVFVVVAAFSSGVEGAAAADTSVPAMIAELEDSLADSPDGVAVSVVAAPLLWTVEQAMRVGAWTVAQFGYTHARNAAEGLVYGAMAYTVFLLARSLWQIRGRVMRP